MGLLPDIGCDLLLCSVHGASVGMGVQLPLGEQWSVSTTTSLHNASFAHRRLHHGQHYSHRFVANSYHKVRQRTRSRPQQLQARKYQRTLTHFFLTTP